MSEATHDHPALRLVNDRVASAHRSSTRGDRSIAAADARWVLAVRIVASLEGGRAAILPPEKREQLTRMAVRMGLRPFDANLIIAIVQDAARTGRAALGHDVADRLMLVRPADPRRSAAAPRRAVVCLLWAAVLAMAVFIAITEWLRT